MRIRRIEATRGTDNRRDRQNRLTTLRHLTMPKKILSYLPYKPITNDAPVVIPSKQNKHRTALTDTQSVDAVVIATPETTPEDIMQRGVQVTQAFRNEIGKAVKTKRLTTGRTPKGFRFGGWYDRDNASKHRDGFVFGITAFTEKGCRGYRFIFQPVKEVAAEFTNNYNWVFIGSAYVFNRHYLYNLMHRIACNGFRSAFL